MDDFGVSFALQMEISFVLFELNNKTYICVKVATKNIVIILLFKKKKGKF